jgi:hypothetical protein
MKDFKSIMVGGEITVIPWEEVKRVLGDERYKEFSKFMYGQTVTFDGVYPCDVENFLRPYNRRFFD